jgi:hypothetical protein
LTLLHKSSDHHPHVAQRHAMQSMFKTTPALRSRRCWSALLASTRLNRTDANAILIG